MLRIDFYKKNELFFFLDKEKEKLNEIAEKFPSIIISLFFLLGTAIRLNPIFCFLTIFALSLKKKLCYLSFCITVFSFFYCYNYYPHLLTEKNCPKIIEGQLTIHEVKTSHNFKKSTYYLGKVNFTYNNKKYKNIKCFVRGIKNTKLSSKFIYKIKAKSFYLSASKLKLTLLSKSVIRKNYFSLSRIRKDLKKRFRSIIYKKVKGREASSLLTAVLIGEITNKALTFHFKKLGLLHILAISGFHFSLLSMLLYFVLNKIFPMRLSYILLFIGSTIYFLFLGYSPSIFRAYLTISIAIFAKLLSRKNYPLNTLMITFIINLIIDPLNLFNIGFQLSFLSVFSILTIYPVVNDLLSIKLIKRTKDDLKKLSIYERICGIAINYIRESFAVTLGVNIILFPLLLYYFHSFPFLTFIYNILIPPLLFISIISFALGFICPPIFSFCSFYNSSLLQVIYNSPKILEFSFWCKIENKFFISLYLIMIIIFSIYYKKEKYLSKKAQLMDFI